MPSVRPSKRSGSVPGPVEYANVHNAVAFRVLKPSSKVFNPSEAGVDVSPRVQRQRSSQMQTCEAQFLEKVFDVWARKSPKSLEAKCSVFCDAWATELDFSIRRAGIEVH